MRGANNKQQLTAPESRREFFRNAVRYAVLSVLTVGGAILGRRSLTRLPDQTCINEGICHGCTAFAGCGLPQALAAKSAAASRQSADLAEIRNPKSETEVTMAAL